MDTLARAYAFLRSGPWIPLEMAAQLVRQLHMLHAWTATHEPLDPSIERVIELELVALDHMLDLGNDSNVLVSVDHWKHSVRQIRLLRNWLTSVR
jgi:hypothetical protein